MNPTRSAQLMRHWHLPDGHPPCWLCHQPTPPHAQVGEARPGDRAVVCLACDCWLAWRARVLREVRR